jgi:hypothetical protein
MLVGPRRCSRPHCRCWPARSDLGVRWSSRHPGTQGLPARCLGGPYHRYPNPDTGPGTPLLWFERGGVFLWLAHSAQHLHKWLSKKCRPLSKKTKSNKSLRLVILRTSMNGTGRARQSRQFIAQVARLSSRAAFVCALVLRQHNTQHLFIGTKARPNLFRGAESILGVAHGFGGTAWAKPCFCSHAEPRSYQDSGSRR